MKQAIVSLALLSLSVAVAHAVAADRTSSDIKAALAVPPAVAAPSPVAVLPGNGAKPTAKPTVVAMCDLIAKASRGHGLPVSYFTRLIWQESRFRPNALSPAGAQGIAQFMPGTASGRGLLDPFSTPEALEESAAYLKELREMFGNLGLAAAAYNAGPGRLSRYLAGQAELPTETLNYVEIVTGHSVGEWRVTTAPEIIKDDGFSCARIAALAGHPSVDVEKERGQLPVRRRDWAVILLGNPQRDKVMAEYQIVRGQFSKFLGGVQPSVVHRRIGGLQVARYIVQIEKDRREDANALCSNLLKAGGSCFVLANKF